MTTDPVPSAGAAATAAPAEPARKRSRAELDSADRVRADPVSSVPASAAASGCSGRKEKVGGKPKGDKSFDFSRFRFRHVALHFLYLGHKYHGFAAQLVSGGYGNGGGGKPRVKDATPASSSSAAAAGGSSDAAASAAASSMSSASPAAASSAAPAAAEQHSVETVESALFQALQRACLIESRGTCGYTRCGRTDAGVSAAGQVVALRLRSKAKLLPPAAGAASSACGAGAAGSGAGAGGAASSGTAPAEAADEHYTTSAAAASVVAAKLDDKDEHYTTPIWQRHDGRDNDAPGLAEDFPPPEGENDYVAMLNGVLPDDIRIIGWANLEAPEGQATADTPAAPGAATAVTAAASAAAAGAACGAGAVGGACAVVAAPPSHVPPPPPPPFSARFSCTRRVYRYFWVNRGYNIAAMRDAAVRLAGTHDFRNFAKYAVANTQNFVRRVESVRVIAVGSPADAAGAYTPASAAAVAANAATVATTAAAAAVAPVAVESGSARAAAAALGGAGAGVGSARVAASASASALEAEAADVPVGSLCFFEVVGQAFLWHQVRCMASVLFHVGAGLEAPSVVDFLLDVAGKCPSRPQYDLAPELPLCLHHCGYGEEQELEKRSSGGAGAAGAAGAAAALAAAEAEERAADSAAAASAGAAAGAMSVDAAASSAAAAAAAAAIGDDDGEGGARPSWAAPCLPSLYRRMHASPGGLAAANAALYARWERMQVECAMLGSMLARLRAFAVSAGLRPWEAAPRDAVCRARKYIPFASRPREPTLAEKWGKLSADEQRKVAAMHPHNTARLLGTLGKV